MLFPWQLSALMRCLRAGLCDGCAAKTALSERSFEIFTAASVFFERRERDYRGLEYARDSAGFACFFFAACCPQLWHRKAPSRHRALCSDRS